MHYNKIYIKINKFYTFFYFLYIKFVTEKRIYKNTEI